MDLLVKGLKKSLTGEYEIIGDKSIGHRSLIIGALAKGEYKVYNFPKNLDCMATLDSMKKLGVDIELKGNTLEVNSLVMKILIRNQRYYRAKIQELQ